MGSSSMYVSGTTGTVTGYGNNAGAMTEDGVLYTFTTGRLGTSDDSVSDLVRFPTSLTGSRSDIDMAIDCYGDPALFLHTETNHEVGLLVRMPLGGYALAATSPESIFVPFPMTSSWLSVDLERTPAGDLAVAIGDNLDRGSFVYREYTY